MEKVVSEKQIERYLVSQVKTEGGMCWKLTVFGVRGVPDRVCLFKGGKIVFVETKRPKGGVVSEWQKRITRKLIDFGFTVFIIKNKEEVDNMMQLIRGNL